MAPKELVVGNLYTHKLGFRALCIGHTKALINSYEFRLDSGNVMRVHASDIETEFEFHGNTP